MFTNKGTSKDSPELFEVRLSPAFKNRPENYAALVWQPCMRLHGTCMCKHPWAMAYRVSFLYRRNHA